jgi:hypothetical protein
MPPGLHSPLKERAARPQDHRRRRRELLHTQSQAVTPMVPVRARYAPRRPVLYR